MNRLAFALVVVAVAGVACSRPAAAVPLAVGNSVMVGGVTFEITSCGGTGNVCPSGDVMVADSNDIGVTVESGTAGSPLLNVNPGTNGDMSLGLSVTSSVAPIVGIQGIITGTSSTGDESHVGMGETITFASTSMTGPTETLQPGSTSNTVTFPGVTFLSIAKDAHALGSLAQDATPLVLNTFSQIVTLQSTRVPEPQSVVLFLTALTGMTVALRRRRRG